MNRERSDTILRAERIERDREERVGGFRLPLSEPLVILAPLEIRVCEIHASETVAS